MIELFYHVFRVAGIIFYSPFLFLHDSIQENKSGHYVHHSTSLFPFFFFYNNDKATGNSRISIHNLFSFSTFHEDAYLGDRLSDTFVN